tara:strand:+ start:151 stop:543 length:393 start_codon:yes stop_codon:yes gene_type:complete
MKYLIILPFLILGCTFLDHITGNVECPPDEYCLDLTQRARNEIFLQLKPIKGWKQIGCIHSKQLDPGTVVEQMYCEYCNKENHQMWMIYDYGEEAWTMSNDEWLNVCGTPHSLYNEALHLKNKEERNLNK